MDLKAELEYLKASLRESEHIQTELDRRVFYLKTLYDVSKDIFASVESETILRNFLLMAMGNFGVSEGLILLMNSQSAQVEHIVTVGIEDNTVESLQKSVGQLILQKNPSKSLEIETDLRKQHLIRVILNFFIPILWKNELAMYEPKL